MVLRSRARGAALVLVCLMMLLAVGSLFVAALTFGVAASRARTTERALAAAREALIAYAADRPIDPVVGPGYLPCPDLDGDGWAESTCGSLDGRSGQEQRLGLLPWKTLGLAELTDGDGERLWYAVSSKYKGLLNCAASRACVDMSPAAALGTITVRDPSGRVLNDGTIATPARAREGGAVAVVLAPGAPLARLAADGARLMQQRACAPGDCDADGVCVTSPPQRAARCAPANYLDRAPGEDNADFADRNDAAGRAGNANGFIQGPVALAGGDVVVNDRLLAITWRDVMPARDAARGARGGALPARLRDAAGERRAVSVARAGVRAVRRGTRYRRRIAGRDRRHAVRAHVGRERGRDARSLVARFSARARAPRGAAHGCRRVPHRHRARRRGTGAQRAARHPGRRGTQRGQRRQCVVECMAAVRVVRAGARLRAGRRRNARLRHGRVRRGGCGRPGSRSRATSRWR